MYAVIIFFVCFIYKHIVCSQDFWNILLSEVQLKFRKTLPLQWLNIQVQDFVLGTNCAKRHENWSIHALATSKLTDGNPILRVKTETFGYARLIEWSFTSSRMTSYIYYLYHHSRKNNILLNDIHKPYFQRKYNVLFDAVSCVPCSNKFKLFTEDPKYFIHPFILNTLLPRRDEIGFPQFTLSISAQSEVMAFMNVDPNYVLTVTYKAGHFKMCPSTSSLSSCQLSCNAENWEGWQHDARSKAGVYNNPSFVYRARQCTMRLAVPSITHTLTEPTLSKSVLIISKAIFSRVKIKEDSSL